MTEDEALQVARTVTKLLQEQRTVDVDTHRKHHEYIDTLITHTELQNARKEQWIRVIGGWGIIAMLTALAAAVWQYIKDHIH